MVHFPLPGLITAGCVSLAEGNPSTGKGQSCRMHLAMMQKACLNAAVKRNPADAVRDLNIKAAQIDLPCIKPHEETNKHLSQMVPPLVN